MPQIINTIQEWPHCPREDYECGDTITAFAVNDSTDKVNYLQRMRPAIMISNTGSFDTGGDVPLMFELPEGHTHFVLTLEFQIQENFISQNGGTLTIPSGNIILDFFLFSNPLARQRINRYFGDIAQYQVITGLALPTQGIEQVGTSYLIKTEIGQFDTNTLNIQQNQANFAALNISMQFPTPQLPQLLSVLSSQSCTNPITGQTFPNGGIFGVSLYTGIL